MSSVDERNLYDEMIDKFELRHLLERELSQLSGGELQRVAICATLLKDAEVYFFDEPSSYLDIHERMRIVRIIQELAESARVIVIEHDLAVLDVNLPDINSFFTSTYFQELKLAGKTVLPFSCFSSFL